MSDFRFPTVRLRLNRASLTATLSVCHAAFLQDLRDRNFRHRSPTPPSARRPLALTGLFHSTPLVPCPFAFQPNLDSVRCVAEPVLVLTKRHVGSGNEIGVGPRRSGVQLLKTAREKIKARRFLWSRSFYFFARCFLRCALINLTPGRGYVGPI